MISLFFFCFVFVFCFFRFRMGLVFSDLSVFFTGLGWVHCSTCFCHFRMVLLISVFSSL